jgi:hypothetical protein
LNYINDLGLYQPTKSGALIPNCRRATRGLLAHELYDKLLSLVGGIVLMLSVWLQNLRITAILVYLRHHSKAKAALIQ